MAKDSLVFSLASQRDSASMKTLSIVGLLYLPGTFVSTLFSTPFFERSSGNGPSAIVYLAVTLPLTLLTFSIWGMWLLLQRNKKSDQIATAQAHLAQDMPEVMALARKRVSTIAGD